MRRTGDDGDARATLPDPFCEDGGNGVVERLAECAFSVVCWWYDVL